MTSSTRISQRRIRRIGLLTNPAAGKGSAVAAADAAREVFGQCGIDVLSIQGATAESSRQLARKIIETGSGEATDPSGMTGLTDTADRAVAVGQRRSAIDALAVCGGDGLINLALQAQALSGMPLGIVPAGTGNDHAREFGIPNNPRRAAEIIAAGWTEQTDLGLMTRYDDDGEKYTQWFGTVACAGFDSLVSDRTNKIRWPRGRVRYNLAIVQEFMNFNSMPTQLTLDPETADERVIEENMTLVAMGNTRSYGGGMLICPAANRADGMLDITVLGRMNRWRAAAKFRKIFTGQFVNEPGVSTYRAQKARITMRKRSGSSPRAMNEDSTMINGYADGDRFGPLPMDVEIVSGAGLYLVPKPE